MSKKRILSFVLATILVICMIPYTAFAADPKVEMVQGVRTAFVSAFGRMNYGGQLYVAFRELKDAFAALGKEGGTVVFTGRADFFEFEDIKGRAPIRVVGAGAKSMDNIISFGTATEINLGGDIEFDFAVIRTSENTYLYTNGYHITTVNEFDTYHVERDDGNGQKYFEYPTPPSIAPGEITSGTGSILLDAGTYETLAAGSVNGKSVNGNTYVKLDGGTVTTVVAGNIGAGTMNGNATLIIGEGKIDKFIAGSAGGVINGDVTARIDGGNIKNTIIGAQEGATINGNVIVTLNGGDFEGTVTAGSGTVTGEKIVIVGSDAKVNVQNNVADYVINISGGFCEPQGAGGKFLVTDQYGIPSLKATINGQAVTSQDGIYTIEKGDTSIAVKTDVNVVVNKNAKYVAGYPDGTFLPQQNMTRAEAITLLTRIITDENTVKGKVKTSFDDVNAGDWYEGYIGFFEKLGYLDTIAEEYGAKIAPNQNITRAEFVELIYNVSNLMAAPSSSMKIKAFTDVKTTNKYVASINYAASNNIVNGYEDGSFRPDANITRAEVATIVNRFLGRIPNNANGTVTFKDIDSHWAKGQILAACNEENVTWTAQVAKPEYVLTGTSAKDYIPALHAQSANLDADAIRRGSDAIAEQMKKDILNTPNTQEIYGDRMVETIYYISEKNGDDNNDGLSPETPWKTFNALSKVRFPKKGTSFLFERGGIYRGNISMANGAIYGSYGEGPKPLFIQSKKNYALPELWEKTEWENVWKCTDQLVNVGVVGFDHDLYDYEGDDIYNETYGLIMNKNTFGFDGPHELKGDLQFYSDISNGTEEPGEFYLYCEGGNPGNRFKSIEIGEKIYTIKGAPKTITIDNIAFKFTGAHAISMTTCSDVTVSNCVFSWIGGSVLNASSGSAVNFGNAVEIYGGCDGYFVENNWMYQIFDTAATHQRAATTGNCIQRNVRYTGNLMEYVYWGIEFYNQPPTDAQLKGGRDIYTRLTEDVISSYNLLRFGGFGWGSITRYRTCLLYNGSVLSENRDCKNEYNIFDRAYGTMLSLPSNSNETSNKNIYIQYSGQPLKLKGVTVVWGYDAAENIQKYWGDADPVTVVIDSNKEPIVLNKPKGLAPQTGY